MNNIEEALFLYEEPEEGSVKEKSFHPQIGLIPFSLADEWYAVDIENVIEIIKAPSITKVPGLPEFILGVTNIRGNIISITGLKKMFALSEGEINHKNRIIVIHAGKKTTGLLVDQAGKPFSAMLDSIQPALATIPEISAEYIRGEIRLQDGRLVTILDLNRIMSSSNMQFE